MSTPASTACPDLEELEAVLAGTPADPARRGHLEVCPVCRDRLAELRANNELLRDVLTASRAPRAGTDNRGTTAVRIEGYDLLGEIRHGAQGIVYKAVQRATRRVVAVKVLLEGRLAVANRRQRFEREIEVVAALRHPFIVTVYDSGITDDGRLFFAMEYVEGRPLDEFVQEQRAANRQPLSLAEALRLFCDICDGVNHAHQRGVIHRDLKPGNILIDADRHPHIVDFGLAKAVGYDSVVSQASVVTAAGQFMGTLAYAAPEQFRGDPDVIDVRTDVYALGVILYELLTGRLPHPPGASLNETIRAVLDTDPPPPSLVAEEHTRINDELDTIVIKALAPAPARRYQTAGELADDLRRFLRGDPIDARRDSQWYVLRKTLHRYRWPVSVGATFVVLLLAFSVAMSVLYRRSTLEAEKAKQIKVFLEDTLGSVEPSRQGADVSVRTVLEEAVHWVEILGGQPEVEASLRTTIGNSYRSLGLYDLAEQQLTSAVDIHRRLLGEEHPLVAQSINALGLLARDRGDLDGAVKLIEQGLEIRRRTLGLEHLEVSMSLQNLASVHTRRGDLVAAEAALRESLALTQRHFPALHPDVAMAQFRLAEVLRIAGRCAEAKVLHEAALRTRKALLHDDHPDVARSLLGLGRTLIAQQRPEEAEPLLRQCLERQSRAVPPSAARLAETQGELGHCLVSLGRLEEAEPLLMASYRAQRETGGDDAPGTALARQRLVELYERWGRLEEAERYRPTASVPHPQPVDSSDE